MPRHKKNLIKVLHSHEIQGISKLSRCAKPLHFFEEFQFLGRKARKTEEFLVEKTWVRERAHKLDVRIRKCTLQNPFEHLSVAGKASKLFLTPELFGYAAVVKTYGMVENTY